MESEVMDVTGSALAHAGVLEVAVMLPEPQARLRVRLPPGEAGRAEAVVHDRSWAAKHYWHERPGVTVYEFDEPLPAGALVLRIPLRTASPG